MSKAPDRSVRSIRVARLADECVRCYVSRVASNKQQVLRLRMTSTSWTSCFAQDDKYVLMQTYLESGDSSSSSNPSGS
jgi:hypothetical protein